MLMVRTGVVAMAAAVVVFKLNAVNREADVDADVAMVAVDAVPEVNLARWWSSS